MSKRLLLFVVLLAIGSCVGSAGIAVAKSQPGSVDPSFGVQGVVTQPRNLIPLSGYYGPFGEGTAIGPEDEILMLQSERECRGGTGTCGVRFFVQRYQREGVLDSGFGDQGRSPSVAVTTAISPSRLPFGGQLGSVAVNPAGEAVVAAVDGGRLVLFRFDRSGQLSAGFGAAGRLATDLGGIVGRPRLAVLADGRILVAFNVPAEGGRSSIGLARFMPDGAPDSSFGAGVPGATIPGAISVSAPSPVEFAVSPGGRIVLGGARCCPSKRSSVFFGRRSTAGHSLMPSTAARPWRNLRVGRSPWLSSVLALPGGRIALVGSSGSGTFVARLLPSGRRDRSFGRAGIVRLKRMAIGVASALADSAGNIYVPGHRSSGEEYVPSRALVARVTRRGRIDRRWGAAPPGYSLLTSSMSEPLAMGFQSGGKLVVFGEYGGDCIRSCYLPGRVLTRLYTSRRQGQ